jgi:S1-C subfamily serine protease
LSGAVVAGVLAETAEEAEFLLPGDIIFGLNNTRIGNLSELRAALDAQPPGATVALQIERMGQLQFILAELQ